MPSSGGALHPSDREPPLGWQNGAVEHKLIALGMNREEVVFHPYWDNANVLSVGGRDGKPIKDVHASLWHIPSQDRVVVAVASWNEHQVDDIAVKVSLEKFGLLPKVSGENLIVMDVETDDVLQETTHRSMGKLYFKYSKSRVPGQVSISLPPLDFKLLLVTKQ